MNSNTSPRRLTVREQLTLSTLWFSLNAVSAALLPIVIPTQILLFVAPGEVGNVRQATFLGWLSTLGAIVSLFMPPFIGTLSDRTRGRFGRRRPYIVGGALCSLLGVPVLIDADNPSTFLIGISLLHIGMNMITASYQSLTPDLVPEDQRGAASGYMGLMTVLGNVGSLALAAWLFGHLSLDSTRDETIRHGVSAYYILVSIVLLIGVIITVTGVHDTPFTPTAEQTKAQPRLPFRTRFVQNWIDPWREYNFTVVFLTRFLVMLGLALFLTFIEYYFAQVAHATNFVQTTAVVAVLALLGAVVSAFLIGIFSDRVKRAPLVSAATICMGLAAFAFVVSSDNFPLWPLGILFGLGFGAYTSVDWALSIDALPSKDTVGKDLGLWSASTTLPAIVAPLLGGTIINIAGRQGQTILGYRLVFASATLALLLAAGFVLLVKERRAITPTIEEARLEQAVVCLQPGANHDYHQDDNDDIPRMILPYTDPLNSSQYVPPANGSHAEVREGFYQGPYPDQRQRS